MSLHVLFAALRKSGVTCILDWPHIHNMPAHSDAAIKALFDSGVRAVFAYGNGQNETGRYREIAASKFPGDITRLRKPVPRPEKSSIPAIKAARHRRKRRLGFS